MQVNLPDLIRVSNPPSLSDALENGATESTAAGNFRVQRIELTDGPSRGVELLCIESDRVRAAICPTRGMSLWKANIDGLDCGWKSAVEGPIHPSHVALDESSGLGWLDGFDELLVRCGLRSFGAPDFDADGKLLFGLHGRVGNIPARNLEVHIDKDHSLLEVSADVHESRFLQWNLRLKAKYVFAMGQSTIEVHDQLENAGATPATAQMLYHINVGPPFLGEGAELALTADRVVARNEHAASDLSSWAEYLAPTSGYEEQVYFSKGKPDPAGWGSALLKAPDGNSSFQVDFKTDTLPYFTQWKNTVGEADGYVTGLEPGTGFPNPRSFEEAKGRLVALAPGQNVEFQLKLSAGKDAGAQQMSANFAASSPEVADFDADWCTPR